MLFTGLVEGSVVSLPDGKTAKVTSAPDTDPITGCLFVTVALEDGAESRYFATEDTLVTVVADGD